MLTRSLTVHKYLLLQSLCLGGGGGGVEILGAYKVTDST